MILGGLVTLCNLALSLAVGAKLVLSPGGGTPERGLAAYFLASAFLGTLCQAVVYGGLVEPALAVPEPVASPLLATAVLGMAVGAVGVLAFTRRAFRPEAGWARGAVAAGASLALGGWLLEALLDGFAVTLVPGPGHWAAWVGRTFPMAWVAAESLRYWSLQRRRLRVGLADPVVANRFLLWGIWSSTAFLNLCADPVARMVYARWAGTGSEMVMEVLRPVVLGTMSVTMVLGVVSAATLFLTFFPTPAYRRWLEGRADAAARAGSA